MRKSGTVISILKDKKSGVQKFGLILDNSETEEACSINTDGNQVKDCASCSGCGFSKQKKGVFVVTGNMVTAVNKSGKNIHIGDSVQLEIQESKAKLQAVFSVFVPALFAAAAAYILYSFFSISRSYVLKKNTLNCYSFLLCSFTGLIIFGIYPTRKCICKWRI